MRAVRFESFGGPITVVEVPDPTPPPAGVVVRVGACGVCRSDWHGWRGHDGDVSLPHVPGHELAGELVAVDGAVKRWSIGDRVTVPFSMGCGACGECGAGHPQVCEQYYQPGFTGPGAFAEYVPLPLADVNLVALPAALDDVTAASLGCRFGTAFRAVVDRARLVAGEWVAVFGCGGVGLAATMIAEAHEGRVVAVDIKPEALTLARDVGATAVLDASGLAPEHVAAAVREITGGGAMVSIDALGATTTVRAGIEALRRRGRFVQVGVLAGDAATQAIPLQRVMFEELEVLGSHGIAAARYGALLDQIARGRLDPAQLVQRVVGLDDVAGVLTSMSEGGPLGVVVAKP